MLNQMTTVLVAPTITAGAYAANDVVGGLLTFDLTGPIPAAALQRDISARDRGRRMGFLRVVTVNDDANVKAVFTLCMFRERPSPFADNAAFEPSFGDLQKMIASVTIAVADYSILNGNAKAVIKGIEMEFDAPDGKLYGYLVCTGTPTYSATSDLSIAITAYLL